MRLGVGLVALGDDDGLDGISGVGRPCRVPERNLVHNIHAFGHPAEHCVTRSAGDAAVFGCAIGFVAVQECRFCGW